MRWAGRRKIGKIKICLSIKAVGQQCRIQIGRCRTNICVSISRMSSQKYRRWCWRWWWIQWNYCFYAWAFVWMHHFWRFYIDLLGVEKKMILANKIKICVISIFKILVRKFCADQIEFNRTLPLCRIQIKQINQTIVWA